MKTLTIVLLFCKLLICQSHLMQSIDNLRRAYNDQEAVFALHEAGKNAIPFLIESMVDSGKTFNFLLNPLNSTIKHLYSMRGFMFLYTIELILLKDSLNGCEYPLELLWLKCPENYLRNQGVIVREKTHTIINYDDLVNIQLLYKSWWKKVAELPIDEIKRRYKTLGNPLKNSPYTWD